jgi:hypothetical protein
MTSNKSWHINDMEILRRIDKRFSVVIGKNPPDVVLPAMPIRILYSGVERDYSLEIKGGKHFFRMGIPETFTPGWSWGPSWDVYKLREDFEQIQSPEDAWRFLNVVGPFRYKRRRQSQQANVLTWSELKGWQDILRRLRGRSSSEWFPTLGIQEVGFKESFHQWDFIAESGDFSEQIWTVSEDTFGWVQGFPQGLSIRRDMYLSREETESVFSTPGSRVPESREWHQAQAVLARRRAERARGNPEGKQQLIAEVTPATALDAILATVYVDKLCGLELQVCALKECNETFEKQSDHGKKMYCSNYHAHLASVRRKRAEARTKKVKQLAGEEKTK